MQDRIGVQSIDFREVQTARADIAHPSGRDRRLIQPTTMRLPPILTETHPCAVRARARIWRASAQRRVRAMTVVVPLEIKEFQLQVGDGPEQRGGETLPPNRADQALDEWMRQWHVRARLDGYAVEGSPSRLPLVEPVQRIMIRAEVRRRRLATHRSIEHAAQRDAIHDAAVYAKADDATRALIHHDQHPVCVEDRRFAAKQVETPQTVLCVTQDREPGRPRRIWFRLVPIRENAPHHILVDGNTEG